MMTGPKRLISMTGAVMCILFAAAVTADAAVVDKVLVVVNDEVITQREFDRTLAPVKKNIEANFSEEEWDEQFEIVETKVLNELINTKLAVSLAKKEELEINEPEVKRRIGTLRSYYRNEEDFLKSLSEKGTNLSELEKDIRDQMLAQKLIEIKVASKIIIPPSEIKDLYDRNTDKLISPSKVKVRGIMVRKSDAGTRTAGLKETDIKKDVAAGIKTDFVAGVLNRTIMKKSIEEIHAELQGGGDFAAMAAEYSEGPYARKGGDMGYIAPGQVLKEIDEVVFGLKKGQISGIVETRIGYHVFLVEDIQDKKPLEFSEVGDYLKEQLYMRKFNTKLEEWFEEEKQDAYISYK